MAGGGQIVGGRGCRKGQGGGVKKGVGRGVGKGGGEGGGEGGWGEVLIEVLNKTGIVTMILVIGMHETKSAEIAFFRGFPQFLAGNPHGMTSQSRKNVIISPKKVRKRDVREISPNYLCKKKQPYWKTEKLPHFEFLNLNISLLNGRQVLIFEI